MAEAAPKGAAEAMNTEAGAEAVPEMKGAAAGEGEAKPGNRKPPTCVIVLGMAGSGKTTWMQRFNASLHMKVNLHCM